MELKQKRIVVTGGAGFLGSFVVEALAARGIRDVGVPRSRDFDLRDGRAIKRMLDAYRPDVLIHLAAVVGGIGANRERPATFFYDNAMMGIQLVDQAWRFGVAKMVISGTICSYPKHAAVPFVEEDLWRGYPEETNAPYGLAKKMLLVQSQAYRAQHGFNSIYLMPVNLYGPRDNFDEETSHVIPALIRRCLEAKANGASEITLWGDGTPTREFLHVRDAAEGIVLATERYDKPEPVNLGVGADIQIFALADKIAKATGFRGEIKWDATKPNGQPRRRVSNARAVREFGFAPKVDLDEGLAETVTWYLSRMGQWQAS